MKKKLHGKIEKSNVLGGGGEEKELDLEFSGSNLKECFEVLVKKVEDSLFLIFFGWLYKPRVFQKCHKRTFVNSMNLHLYIFFV